MTVEPAIVDLYRRERSRLVGYCRRFADTNDDAEDLAQDAWLALWRKRERIRKSPGGLIYLIARSRGWRQGARRRRDASFTTPEAIRLDRSADHATPAPPDPTIADRMVAAFRGMPTSHRRVAAGVILDGLSRSEAAVVAGLRPDCGRPTFWSARRRLIAAI